MNTSSICVPNADDFFGPRVETCWRQFDFTLLFEQSVLSIAPSVLFICLFSLWIAQLYRVGRKTLPNSLRDVKIGDQKLQISSRIAANKGADCNINTSMSTGCYSCIMGSVQKPTDTHNTTFSGNISGRWLTNQRRQQIKTLATPWSVQQR